jgi:hypothetical protein
VLTSIDEALDDYITWDGDSDDALSWEANPAEPFDEDAWLQDGVIDEGEIDADIQVVRICADLGRRSVAWSADPEAMARSVSVISDAMRLQVESLKSAFMSIGKMVIKTIEANHPSFARMTMGDDYRRHRRACRLCNPSGNPKPLKVNGAEYRRRTRSRRRKNQR